LEIFATSGTGMQVMHGLGAQQPAAAHSSQADEAQAAFSPAQLAAGDVKTMPRSSSPVRAWSIGTS
jgi:hypothetical protein